MDSPKFPNEVELGYKFLNGDNEALGELYKLYYQPLILIAYKHLVDTEISKDVVCTVFEKLLQLQKYVTKPIRYGANQMETSLRKIGKKQKSGKNNQLSKG